MARMLRSEPPAPPNPIPEPLLAQLVAGCDERTARERVDFAQRLRREYPDGGAQLDGFLLGRVSQLTASLGKAKLVHEELREVVARLSATPWYPATFVRACDTAVGPRALVALDGARRLVAVAVEVDLNALAAGDEVYLGAERNVILSSARQVLPPCGEVATFESRLADGRIALRLNDGTAIVDAGAALERTALASGDPVLCDRRAGIAFEKVHQPASRRYFLSDLPCLTRAQVGGQDANLEVLLSALTVALVDPLRADRYQLGGRQSILLVGPPGTGKTLLARVAAAELSRLTGKLCRFAVVKPGEFESPFVGTTQQNIRECFQALREAAEEGPTVLFLDEVEAIGRIRGGAVNQHADSFLMALLAELDGFVARSGVAIVAATNRKNLIDPALLERLSDVELVVGRPDMRAARQIFEIHLADSLPFAAGDGGAAAARAEIIDGAVSRIYGPNADNQLCTLHLRDGRAREVHARELASGRTFEQICRAARRQALLRDLHGGEPGLRRGDVEDAIADALARLATSLSPRNAHAHVADLPQDVDVVRVEPVVRRVSHPHRYRTAA